MRINYNVTGAKRKELAQVISRVTGAKAEYQYMPTCAYVIDFFTLSKDGVLEFDDRSDTEIVEAVLEAIADAGFECEAQDEPEADEVSEPEAAGSADEKVSETAAEDDATEAETNETAEDAESTDQKETDETVEQPTESGDSAQEDTPEESETAEADDTTEDAEETIGLTISVPMASVAVGNLTKLLEAKGNLIRKALGIDSLPIEICEDAVSFPWFSELPDVDETAAYTHLISALCKMSKEQKRVTATEREVANEKYAFRCFLLRLGFIGEQYKQDRKILLKNLTGSSAFRSGSRREAVVDEA